jgi:V/A-type H+/Na+-transporting ATPase subunit I
MILPMSKVRLLGARELLPEVLPLLQDFGQLHLTPPRETAGMWLVRRDVSDERRARQLGRVRQAVTGALDALGEPPEAKKAAGTFADRALLASWARRARSAHREARELRAQIIALEEERAFLARYWHFFGPFQDLAEAASRWPGAAAYHVVLPRGGERALARLREGLREMLGEEFEIWSRQIDTGETGVLILVSGTSSEQLEKLFATERVEEIELPGASEGVPPSQAIPRIVGRYDAILEEIRGLEASLAGSARRTARPS